MWRRRGAPKTIDDLHDHNCIGFRLIGSGGVYEWELNDSGKEVTAKTSGTALVTDATHARELALAGVGIPPTSSSRWFAITCARGRSRGFCR